MSMMTAAVFHEHGERDVIQVERVPIPQPAADEARVKVGACALNWLDVGIRRGPQFGAVPLPLITGVDVSGVIDAVGSAVEAGVRATPSPFTRLSPAANVSFVAAAKSPSARITGSSAST